METETWSIRDARRARHSGVLVITDRLSNLPVLLPPQEFRIVLLTNRRRMAPPLDGTAVCVPSETQPALRSGASARRLDRSTMAAYREGAIICALPVQSTPAQIFPPASERPRFNRLALEIINAKRTEQVASFLAVVGAELKLRPALDRLAELERRLRPAEVRDRPPTGAPGVVRLRAALRALRTGTPPDTSLEQFVDDLRLLKLFAPDDEWSRPALGRLLADVDPTPGKAPAAHRRQVVPMSRRRARDR